VTPTPKVHESFLDTSNRKLRLSEARWRGLAIFLVVYLVPLLAVFAHNPDTSYTRIKVTPEHIEFKFTFDVITLLKIADLDENRDHQITREEIDKQSAGFYEWLRRRVKLSIEEKPSDFGEPQPIEISDNLKVIPEQDYHITLVHLTFRKELLWMPQDFELVYEMFDDLGDRHNNLASIEERGQNTEEIIFNKFEPDYQYFTNTPVPLSHRLLKFLRLGVQHIFGGPDHVLFLLALLVVSRFWELVKVVTAFTVAHTITLILAATQLVTLPSRLI